MNTMNPVGAPPKKAINLGGNTVLHLRAAYVPMSQGVAEAVTISSSHSFEQRGKNTPLCRRSVVSHNVTHHQCDVTAVSVEIKDTDPFQPDQIYILIEVSGFFRNAGIVPFSKLQKRNFFSSTGLPCSPNTEWADRG